MLKRFRAWVDETGVDTLSIQQLVSFLESDPQFKCSGPTAEKLVQEAILQVNKAPTSQQGAAVLGKLSLCPDHFGLFLKEFYERSLTVMLPSNVTHLKGCLLAPNIVISTTSYTLSYQLLHMYVYHTHCQIRS